MTVKPFFLFAVFFAWNASAQDVDRLSEVQKDLEELRKASESTEAFSAYMDRAPTRVHSETVATTTPLTPSFEERDRVRKTFCKMFNGTKVCLGDILPGKAPPASNDLAQDLVDHPGTMVRTLEQMEKNALMKGSVAEAPWSDDYWPIYKGGIASRYAHPKLPKGEDWFRFFEFSKNASAVEFLSPSEKYDLLVGDSNKNLTNNMWGEGRYYYDNSPGNKVETWMGYCHGWAAAAYMLDRPENAVTLHAPDGTAIPFYPSDIKALATVLWSNAAPYTRFIGGRCSDKNPQKDANGRIRSATCFDTNPSSWHLAIVNQIGVARRSFIMDATFDYEVWNQPVRSYQYSYFNPQTQRDEAQLSQALVRIDQFPGDRFRQYRSPRARYIVGIAMDVVYVVETQPTHQQRDSETNDATSRVRYLYDLELDSEFRIVGGEWYGNKHPDFLWTPAPDARALSVADHYLAGDWDGTEPLPSAWSQAAARASRKGQPLARVVETLIRLSREQ